MKRYLVMQRGHKVGHVHLPYGEEVTARSLGCRKSELEPFIARGVLKIVKKRSAPTPQNEEVDVGQQQDLENGPTH